MSQWSQPVPPQRIGDVERDKAAEFLREHLAQGRLEPDEFEERITKALSAKWQSDLDQLFVDLPAPTPQADRWAPPPAPVRLPPEERMPGLLSNSTRKLMDALSIAIWPIAILGTAASQGRAIALILVAIVLTSMWHRRRSQDNIARGRLARQDEAERRRLEQERDRYNRGGH